MAFNIIISDNKGHYISLEPTQRPIIVDDIKKAYHWNNIKKAQNALENLPKRIANKELFSLSPITTTTNKSPLKNKDFLNSIFTDLSVDIVKDEELRDKLLEVNLALSDLKHFIEFEKFNVFEGFIVLIFFQKLLIYRRKIKDKIYTSKTNVTPFELEYRCYHPRVIKELFKWLKRLYL